MKKIEDYTTNELSAKIEAIKAELEKTANALKRYEEEQERRGLGVPSDGIFYIDWRGQANEDRFERVETVAYNAFSSKESAEKHAEMLLAWRKALVANSKGEPIDIKVLLPFLRKGKVAFCPIVGSWFWTNKRPVCSGDTWKILGHYEWLKEFNIKPADDWETSLMECGL